MQRFSFIHEWSTKLLPFIFLLLFLDSILWSHQSTQKSIQQTTLQLLLFYRVEKKMSIICLSQDAAAACSSSSKLVSSSLSLLTKDTKVLLLLSPFTNVSFWKMYESLSCLPLVAESNFFCRLRKIPLLNLKLEKKVFFVSFEVQFISK